MIAVAQQLLDEGMLDPVELCRVLLTIASLQEDLYVLRTTGRGSLGALLTSLTAAIRHRSLYFASSEPDSIVESAGTCVHLCVKLNERLPTFVQSELIDVLLFLQ